MQQRDHLLQRERGALGAEDEFAGADERDNQQQLQWVHDVVHRLDGGQVEAERDGNSSAEQAGAAHHREDAEDDAERDGQRDLLRGDALQEQPLDGADDAVLEKFAQLMFSG